MVSRYAHVGEQHTADILQKMTSKFLEAASDEAS